MARRRFLLLGAAALATACTRSVQAKPSSPPASARPPLSAHPIRGIWPAEYHAAPQQVQGAYAWAATHENVLRYIPCFCGCVADGHKNNYDCFVRGTAVNGWISMDLHGLSCGTCVAITLESAVMIDKA